MLVSAPDTEIISHEIMLVRGGASRVIIVRVESVCVAGRGRTGLRVGGAGTGVRQGKAGEGG